MLQHAPYIYPALSLTAMNCGTILNAGQQKKSFYHRQPYLRIRPCLSMGNQKSNQHLVSPLERASQKI
jgi:hypothetical protein